MPKTLPLALSLAASALLFACAPTPDASEPAPVEAENGLSARSDARCDVFSRTACLINSASNKRDMTINYPALSWCEVSFVGSGIGGDLEGLAGDLEISVPDYDRGGKLVLTPQLSDDGLTVQLGTKVLYQTSLTVRSKSGKSLDSVIRKRLDEPAFGGGPSTLIAIPKACPPK